MTYDSWRLATPPEYDDPTECPRCGADLGWDARGPYCPEPTGSCAVCGLPEMGHGDDPDACGAYAVDSLGCGWSPADDAPDPDAKWDDRDI